MNTRPWVKIDAINDPFKDFKALIYIPELVEIRSMGLMGSPSLLASK